MRLILIEANPELLLDRTVSILTNTHYRHACMCFPTITQALLFESSLKKGGVVPYRHFKDLKDSQIVVYDVPIDSEVTLLDAFHFAISKIGHKYDLTGFLLWCFNRSTPGKLYCFEYVLKALGQLGTINGLSIVPMVNLMRGTSISGADIETILRQCNVAVSFRGKAKVYTELVGLSS